MPDLVAGNGVSLQVIGSHGLWLIPIVTTLGGLISGLLVYSLAPEAEGHGTDTVVKAFHQASGFLRARVPGLKMLASAITIGTGGSAGREGPTALISAGIGSIYASLGRRSEDDRRLLTLIGMASGLSAIFRSPIGTAFFAIEVLYANMEFDASALLYTMIGSVVAYIVNGWFVGFQPLFQIPQNLTVSSVADYSWYIVLGIFSGLVATILPNMFYLLRDAFHALPGPPHIKPAIGGLFLGLLALALPQVLGGGYGWMQMAIDGKLALGSGGRVSFRQDDRIRIYSFFGWLGGRVCTQSVRRRHGWQLPGIAVRKAARGVRSGRYGGSFWGRSQGSNCNAADGQRNDRWV